MKNLKKTLSSSFAFFLVMLILDCPDLHAQSMDSQQALKTAFDRAADLTVKGRYIDAATTYFNIYTAESRYQNIALALVAESLIKAGYPNSASYFFIKTLQTGDRSSIRRVLHFLPQMMDSVGVDLLKSYVLKHTQNDDYDAKTRSYFYYFVGKDQLLKDDTKEALASLSKVTASSGSGLYVQSTYMRGVAYAILGQAQNAIQSFASCAKMASKTEGRSRWLKKEFFDLGARCNASLARTFYQIGDYEKAEEIYDEIPKASFVWTDILFEQAWNSYAKGDYNRSLGKLITYRSPSLGFVFNPESDVLRAQSFLALCQYDEVEKTAEDFTSRYSSVGSQMKRFLLSNDESLIEFYDLAHRVFYRKLHTNDMMSKALNRFIRGPYFASLVQQQRVTEAERERALHDIRGENQKFGEFIQKVVGWRLRSIKLLGGVFVKNSMVDLYRDLIADLDKMSFIKLDMLKRAKTSLERKSLMSEDEDGNMKKGSSSIDRKDNQYFWSFNGEFWIDELGDYVFALESKCGG